MLIFFGPDRNNLNQVRRPFSETRRKRWKKYKFSSFHVPVHYFSTQNVHLNHFNMVAIDSITFAIICDKSAILMFFKMAAEIHFLPILAVLRVIEAGPWCQNVCFNKHKRICYFTVYLQEYSHLGFFKMAAKTHVFTHCSSSRPHRDMSLVSKCRYSYQETNKL